MSLTVTVRRSLGSISELAPEWSELHDSSGSTLPFSGPAWGLTWLRHFCDDANSPAVYEVRDSDKLIGVAAYYRHRMPRGLARLQPVGTGLEWIGPFEIPTMLAAQGRGRDVARSVVDEICQEFDSWDWANVAPGEVAPWFEPEWLPADSYTEIVKQVLAAVVIDLDIPRVEDVLVGRRNVKESIRRAKNRLTKTYGSDGWSVERITDPGAVVPAFERLVALHEERSRSLAHSESHMNVFQSPAALSFVADVVQQLADTGRVSVYELITVGGVIASQLILHTSTASYSSVSGISEQGWPFSAVTYLQWHAIRHAHELGHQQFNLSIGPNQAKLRWSNSVRYFPDFVVVGPRRRSRIASSGAQVWSSVAAYRAAARKRRVPQQAARSVGSTAPR